METRERAARMLAASPSTTTPSTLSLLSSSKSISSFPFVHRLSVPNSNASSTSFPIVAKAATRQESRTARHVRIRKKVIDDTKMHTLASASTMQKPVSEEFDYSARPTIEIAQKVGEAIAKVCAEKGITKVAFDRGGYRYHGRIEALAAAARENGLEF